MKRSAEVERSIFLKAICLIFLMNCIGVYAFGVEIEFIENPKPTHIEQEKHYKKMVLVKTISADFDEEYFLAAPSSITVDDEGSIYIFDYKLNKIFKFSKDFKFIKTFGSAGQGPGEFSDLPYPNKELYFAREGLIHLSSSPTKKIIAYKKDGSFVKEIPSPKYLPGYVPIIDKRGNYYLPSKEGAVVVYNKERRKIHTYLDREAYRTFILMKPFEQQILNETRMSTFNTSYDLLSDNRFIIYIFNSSTVYLFKGRHLERKIRIWPKVPMKIVKRRIGILRKENKEKNWIVYLFNNFFIDKDNGKYFYFESAINEKGQKMLYKFSLDGELVNILCIDKRKFSGSILTKSNNLIFGWTLDGDVKIMKEEK